MSFFSRNDIYIDDRDKSIPLTKDEKAEVQRMLMLAKEDEFELTEEGRLICEECPVRLSCLSHYFEHDESKDLMFGGYRMWVEDEQNDAYVEYTSL